MSFAPGAFADPAAVTSGKVTFKGEVTSSTCSLDTDSADKAVKLPKISTNSLAKDGEVAGSTMFDLVVSNCAADIKKVAAHFETDKMDPDTRQLINQAENGAGNVQVQLLDRDGTTKIPLGSAGQYVEVNGTGTARGATLTYGGQYYATGAVKAGAVMAIARFTLAYE